MLRRALTCTFATCCQFFHSCLYGLANLLPAARTEESGAVRFAPSLLLGRRAAVFGAIRTPFPISMSLSADQRADGITCSTAVSTGDRISSISGSGPIPILAQDHSTLHTQALLSPCVRASMQPRPRHPCPATSGNMIHTKLAKRESARRVGMPSAQTYFIAGIASTRTSSRSHPWDVRAIRFSSSA